MKSLQSLVTAAMLAACSMISFAPRTAHAFCVNCDLVPVLEYVNELNGDILLLPSFDPEVAIVESGRAGPGWQRTGNDFTTSTFADRPVCRFYSPVFHSHFYTADPGECAAVKTNADWIYEKVPFSAFATERTSCTTPVYRVFRGGDHRWTADAGFRQQLLGHGWMDEGIGFCARSGGRGPLESITMSTYPNLADTPGCVNMFGQCAALEALAPMSNKVPPYLPPNYITINPGYPSAAAGPLTGSNGGFDIWTAQAPGAQIALHSFAGLNGQAYVNGSDRLSGNYAGVSPTIVLPGVAGAHGDERVFVWRAASDRELRLTAFVSVGLVARDTPGAHAYGHPLLEFGDATSGHSFIMTIQAFGTVPPGDFAGPDARTGEAIVSTVFRPDPRFGSVLSGSFTPCVGDGTPCRIPEPYAFSLKRADFKAALDLARGVDPALSADPASYFLGRVAFHNETYLDARLGVTVTGMTAAIWYVE